MGAVGGAPHLQSPHWHCVALGLQQQPPATFVSPRCFVEQQLSVTSDWQHDGDSTVAACVSAAQLQDGREEIVTHGNVIAITAHKAAMDINVFRAGDLCQSIRLLFAGSRYKSITSARRHAK